MPVVVNVVGVVVRSSRGFCQADILFYRGLQAAAADGLVDDALFDVSHRPLEAGGRQRRGGAHGGHGVHGGHGKGGHLLAVGGDVHHDVGRPGRGHGKAGGLKRKAVGVVGRIQAVQRAGLHLDLIV